MDEGLPKKAELKNETVDFTCWMCQEIFQLEENYLNHQKSHMRSLKLIETNSVENIKKSTAEKQLLCIYCNEEFCSEIDRTQHYSLVHPNPLDSDSDS
jgi:hypothetical protein